VGSGWALKSAVKTDGSGGSGQQLSPFEVIVMGVSVAPFLKRNCYGFL